MMKRTNLCWELGVFFHVENPRKKNRRTTNLIEKERHGFIIYIKVKQP
jgi:hypothetical protein